MSFARMTTMERKTVSFDMSKVTVIKGNGEEEEKLMFPPQISDPVPFIRTLRKAFGYKILVQLFASAHLLKGFLKTMCESPIPWILGSKNVAGPRMQVLNQFIHMPYALKPMLGLTSDFLPLFGYHKMPYAVIATIGMLLALAILGFVDHATLSANFLAGCFFFIWLGIAWNDLLVQAKYSEKINRAPALGPSLISYIWFGTYFFQMLAVGIVGLIMQYFGNSVPYMMCIPVAYFLLLPTLSNYMEEKKSTPQEMAVRRSEISQHKYVVVLVFVTLVCNISLAICTFTTDDIPTQALVTLIVAIFSIIAMSLLLAPQIAMVNSFTVVQGTLALSIQGGSFYFYVDDYEAFPDGPHFSPTFLTTIMGVVSSLFFLLGITIYQKYLSDWSYRSIFMFTNLSACFLTFFDVAFFLRVNRMFHVNDHIWALMSTASQTLVHEWLYFPCLLITAQMCPEKIESTQFVF